MVDKASPMFTNTLLYVRKIPSYLCHDRLIKKMCKKIFRNVGKLGGKIKPVSYTHLDVYKRQEYTYEVQQELYEISCTFHKHYYIATCIGSGLSLIHI